MPSGAITFDFHNTLAVCDRWFQLETHDFAAEWLAWQAARHGAAPDERRLADARLLYRALRRAIMDHGEELPAERCVAVVLDQLGVAVDPTAVAEGVDVLMRDAFATVSPVPGAIPTVRTLADAGVPLGIVSSAVHHPFLEWTLDAFGLQSAFRVVTTSASAGYYKSRPEIFWQTLELLGASPGASVHVGDSYRFDVGGARRAGMRAVWLQRPGASPIPDIPPPALTVSSLVDVAPQLLRLVAERA